MLKREPETLSCELHCKVCAKKCCGTCEYGFLAAGGPDSLVVSCELRIVQVTETFPRKQPIMPVDPETGKPCAHYELKRRV